MNTTKFNRLLPSGYTTKFVAAEDETVDDEVAILLHGAETRWALQIGGGSYVGLNEYGFDEQGEIYSSRCHGTFRDVAAALARLTLLL